jgi:prevent-host-death family protein
MARRVASKVPVVRRLPITQVRNALGEVVRRVHTDKEYVILEKGGRPVAAIMDIDEFEDYLDLHDRQVQRHVAQSRKEYRAGNSRPAEVLSAELHAQIPAQEPAAKRR